MTRGGRGRRPRAALPVRAAPTRCRGRIDQVDHVQAVSEPARTVWIAAWSAATRAAADRAPRRSNRATRPRMATGSLQHRRLDPSDGEAADRRDGPSRRGRRRRCRGSGVGSSATVGKRAATRSPHRGPGRSASPVAARGRARVDGHRAEHLVDGGPTRGHVASQQLALGVAIPLADREGRHLDQSSRRRRLDVVLGGALSRASVAVAWSHRSRRISDPSDRKTMSRRPWVAATAPEAQAEGQDGRQLQPASGGGFVGPLCELGDGVGLEPRSDGLVSGSPAARARRTWTAASRPVAVVGQAFTRPRWIRAWSSGSAAARSRWDGRHERRLIGQRRGDDVFAGLRLHRSPRRTGRRREQRVYSRAAGFRQSTLGSAGSRPRAAAVPARTWETRGA